MANETTISADDFLAATEICKIFPLGRCMQAAAALMDHFRLLGQPIIFINLENEAVQGRIMFKGRKQVSESGKHWAVILHGKVFDNVHPNGEKYEDWLKNFEYVSDVTKRPCVVSAANIERWTYEQLLDLFARIDCDHLGEDIKPKRTE